MTQERTLPKVLFIARNYPPIIGGLENNAYNFYQHMSAITETHLLANPQGKSRLVQFFIETFFYLIFHSSRFDIIHFNDAVMAPFIPVIRLFSRAKITFIINGLDIVYHHPLYQLIIPFFLKRAELLFPVSLNTKRECEKRGINPQRLQHIPNGINLKDLPIIESQSAQEFLTKHSINSLHKKILVSVGRLVERKGNAWFLQEVFPLLPEDYIYIIAGNGPQRQRILEIIEQKEWSDRVYLVGWITEDEKLAMFRCADLFIMPNISIKNDLEGFGIVILEAGYTNLPVVATDVDGIPSAVIPGATGILVPEGDATSFADAILNIHLDREKISSVVDECYNWTKIADQYLQAFVRLAQTTN